MNFHHLSHSDLIANFSDLVRKERQMTAQVLECIAEIDRRRLYLEKGYSSLFDFLVRDYGYSPGAAMRRVDGARLLRELPDVKEKIERGTLTLSQANQIQRAAREMKKTERALSTEEKQELVQQVEHASKNETEKIIAERLNLPVMPVQKETLHRDASVTLTMTFSAEQIEVLEQVRSMVSHAVNSQSWSELCVYLAKKELARRTNTRSSNMRSAKTKSINIATPSNFNVAATVKIRSALPARVRKALLNPAARCQYKNHKGEQCHSSRYLQIDHIQSLSRGGSDDIENLQVLCGTHNRYKYVSGG
jgi:5-methylcytosine-specific restriction endonuclease McrA/DNA-binding NarL/FixJ family response regulator